MTIKNELKHRKSNNNNKTIKASESKDVGFSPDSQRGRESSSTREIGEGLAVAGEPGCPLGRGNWNDCPGWGEPHNSTTLNRTLWGGGGHLDKQEQTAACPLTADAEVAPNHYQ